MPPGPQARGACPNGRLVLPGGGGAADGQDARTARPTRMGKARTATGPSGWRRASRWGCRGGVPVPVHGLRRVPDRVWAVPEPAPGSGEEAG
ncbi:hypothetical protein GCM10009551_085420 [Nocardiopsis tropica]